MVTALDRKLRPKAQSLIEKYGTSAVLYSVPSDASYDASSGTVVTDALSYDVKLAVVGSRKTFTMGELVYHNVVEAMIADQGLSAQPKQGDRLVVDGREYRVLAANPTYSGDQVAIWSVMLES